MSMCAGMSMTEAPCCRRTIASSVVSAIVPSVEPHDQLDRVVFLVAHHSKVVDHVLDQEESPPTWLLQSRELRFQVGRGRLRDLASAAVVDDAHDQIAVRGVDLDPHR